jgi:hypothetical protein
MTAKAWDRLDLALVVALLLAAIVVIAATPLASSAQGWGILAVVCAQIIRHFAFKVVIRRARAAEERSGPVSSD